MVLGGAPPSRGRSISGRRETSFRRTPPGLVGAPSEAEDLARLPSRSVDSLSEISESSVVRRQNHEDLERELSMIRRRELSLRQRIYVTLEDPGYSVFSKYYSIFMMLLILVATTCFVLESEAINTTGILYGTPALVCAQSSQRPPRYGALPLMRALCVPPPAPHAPHHHSATPPPPQHGP